VMPHAQMRISRCGVRTYYIDGREVTKAEHDAEVRRSNALSKEAHLAEAEALYRARRQEREAAELRRGRGSDKRSHIDAPNIIDRDGRWGLENGGRGHLSHSLSTAEKPVYVQSKGELEQRAAAIGGTTTSDFSRFATGHKKARDRAKPKMEQLDALLDE